MSNIVIIEDEILLRIEGKIDQLMRVNQQTEKNELMRIEEVSDLLKVDKRTIHNLKSDGILGFTTLGRSVFIKRSEIMKILEDNYIPPKLMN